MNPRSLTKSLLPLVCGLVPLLSSCMTSKVSDPGDIAGGSDEIDTRVAVTRTGHPVAGARIALLRASDSTGVPVALNATADDGSYPKFAVPDGYYAVVLSDTLTGLGKYVDSLLIVGHTVPKGRDTLLSLGSVRGVVRVGPGQSPATVTIGLLGTDIVANVKADGTFLVDLVPGSLYTLAAFPRLDGYGPLYRRIQLADGQNLVLSDTLVMPYTGLPTPGGLRVLEDSVTGNVKLLWNRVDHPDLLGYVVEKVEAGSVTASQYVTDTVWTDSLRGYWEGLPLLGPWPSRDVAYRVRSRSLSGGPDSRSVAQTFTAKPPVWTKGVDSTKLRFEQDSVTGNLKVYWNRLKNPSLGGYVVERKGVYGFESVTSLLNDSTWMDSLGHHWDSLPILGPWPNLVACYRVRAFSRNHSSLVQSDSFSFATKAPLWTKRVDTGDVWAVLDTTTQNVRVRWNRVLHPALKGYAVERLEAGKVVSSKILTDTLWVDSVGRYWDSLPLLGPWADRSLTYRVRLVSNIKDADAIGTISGLLIKPPSWTKSVDSTKAVVVQDSLTGNVRVTWKKVVHPRLAGYVVERDDGNSVVSSPVLTDSNWVDTLGRYWETLPLLGPWPIRNVTYRIRLVGKPGAIDALSSGTHLSAKPPEWSKHVDSVKVTAVTDSVTRITTLKWNVPTHPDLKGWTVTRTVNGVQDCSGQTIVGEWGGAKCALPGESVVDSSVSPNDLVKLIRQQKSEVNYSVVARRKFGVDSSVARIGVASLMYVSVNWTDSTSVESVMMVNDVFVKTDLDKNVSFSKDGMNWENKPSIPGFLTCKGDSAWIVSMDSDSIHVLVNSRASPGVWTRKRFLLPDKMDLLTRPEVVSGQLVVRYQPRYYVDGWPGSRSFQISGDTLAEVQLYPKGTPQYAYNIEWFGCLSGSSDSRYVARKDWHSYLDIFTLSGYDLTRKVRLSLESSDAMYVFFIGMIGRDGAYVIQRQNRISPDSVYAAYCNNQGACYSLSLPPGYNPGFGYQDLWIVRDEIWIRIGANHLWKGKLNLPK